MHIILISEGSCDTEDCSNDADNSALITEINYVFKYIQIESIIYIIILKCNNISQKIVISQHKHKCAVFIMKYKYCSFGEHKILPFKNIKSGTDSKLSCVYLHN